MTMAKRQKAVQESSDGLDDLGLPLHPKLLIPDMNPDADEQTYLRAFPNAKDDDLRELLHMRRTSASEDGIDGNEGLEDLAPDDESDEDDSSDSEDPMEVEAPRSNGRAYARPPGPPPSVIPLSAPPMVAPREIPPNSIQLRVYRVGSDTGYRPAERGTLPLTATTGDLLRRWPPGPKDFTLDQTMTYHLMPVDALGNPTRGQPFVVDIAAEHDALKVASAPSASAPSLVHPAPSAGISPEIMDFVKSQVDAARADAEAIRAEYARKEQRLDEIRASLDRQQSHVSTENTGALLAMQESLLDKDAKRSEFANTQLITLFNQQQKGMESFYAAMMESSRNDREAERNRMREEEARRVREAEAERERMKAQAEMERQLLREHVQAMAALNTAKVEARIAGNDLGGQMKQLADLKGVFQELGMVKTGEEHHPQSIAEVIREGIRDLVNANVEMARIKAGMMAAANAAGAGGDDEDDEDEDDSDEGSGETEAPQIASTSIPQPAVQRTTPPQKPRIHADVKRLDPKVTLEARSAIKVTVRNLKAAPREKWNDIAQGAVMAAPSILPYMDAAGVQNAILEGGANETLAMEITNAIFTSGAIPSTIPRMK